MSLWNPSRRHLRARDAEQIKQTTIGQTRLGFPPLEVALPGLTRRSVGCGECQESDEGLHIGLEYIRASGG